ncbi:MAG: sulfatase family protein, partial [Bryobacteraceae bacterium]
VRDERYKYIRNFLPDRPYTQFNEYIQRQYPTLGVMQQLRAQGKLDAVPSLWMQARRPEIEFYDTQEDPHEIRNLAGRPEHRARIAEFGRRLDAWMKETGDQGGSPDPGE